MAAQSASAQQGRQRFASAERERGRWARELHDDTLQRLAALRLGLAAARRAGTRDALAEAVTAAIDQLADDISGLRALIADLRPAALDQLCAKAAIQALAERVARDGLGVDVEVDLADKDGQVATRLTPEVEITVYRIVQEALTNAVKNGHATRVVVEVIEADDMIEVTIRDDGAGFDPARQTEGFEILGTRERARLLGGSLRVESAPGQGSTVHATLAVEHRAMIGTPVDVDRVG